MRRSACFLFILALAASARAGDLPTTAKSVLADRKPAPVREVELPPGTRTTAILPDGEEAPLVCILGPIRRLPMGPTVSVPEAWTYFVEPLNRSLGDADLKALAGLPDLEWLDLTRCAGLTEPAVEKLRAALPDCRITGPNDMRFGPNTPAKVRPR